MGLILDPNEKIKYRNTFNRPLKKSLRHPSYCKPTSQNSLQTIFFGAARGKAPLKSSLFDPLPNFSTACQSRLK